MKTKIKILILSIIILSITACCKDEPPTPEIKLSKSELTLEVGQKEKINISGGDGKNYTVSPSNSELVKAVISGNTLTITGKKEGEITLKVYSAGREAPLKVKINPKPVPDLGATTGIYDLEGKALLVYNMTARSKNGLWLCESGADPYEKRIFLPYYREGEEEILIIAEGFSSPVINTPPEGRKFPITKEKDLDDGKVQLSSGNFRLIVEKK